MHGISVIIPNFNRGHLLDIILPSIYNQNFDDYEILVIDDRSVDKTKKIVEGHQEICDKIEYIKIEKSKIKIDERYRPLLKGDISSGFINANYPLNIGIRRAKYDVVMLSNPEILFIQDILKKIYLFHRMREYPVWTSIHGYLRPKKDGAGFDTKMKYSLMALEEFKALKLYRDMFFVCEKLKNYAKIVEWAERWEYEKVYFPQPYCASITKEPLVTLRGFDESHYGWGAGDLELLSRCRDFGVKIENFTTDEPVWVHLGHELQPCQGSQYNEQIMSEKLKNPSSEPIERNIRNDENWGVI